MEALTAPPQTATFIPLAEHRSATPASFYSGPPVLHYHSNRSKIIVLEREVTENALLQPLFQQSKPSTEKSNGEETSTNGTSSSDETQQVVDDVDIWVTSDKLLIYSQSAATGLSISYPSISLHAIQTLPSRNTDASTRSQGVYTQLLPPSNPASYPADQDDEEQDSLSMTIIPTALAPPQGPGAPPTADGEDEADVVEEEEKAPQTPAEALFTALSACADLHPDPVEEEGGIGDGGMETGDEDGIGGSTLVRAGLATILHDRGVSGSDGLPPPMPGSGGWITAENMHEFVDEDGNWIEGEGGEDDEGEKSLGPGAGTVRTRGDEDEMEQDGGEETKWRKTG